MSSGLLFVVHCRRFHHFTIVFYCTIVLLCVVNDNNDDNDADGEMMPDGGLSSIGRGLL